MSFSQMGLDLCGLQTLIRGIQFAGNIDTFLMLGRQEIHVPYYLMKDVGNMFGINIPETVMEYYAEQLIKYLGATHIDSMDGSNYEQATIIQNLNVPVENTLKNRFDFIYDGGTIEHIINQPQVCQNIIDMLKVGGVFCSITANNHMSGHGFYQFSPEFFFRVFDKNYGMEIHDIHLAEYHTWFKDWKKIERMNINQNRSQDKFNSTNPVYIITMAKKISNDRLKLTDVFPNQYNYEEIDWKR